MDATEFRRASHAVWEAMAAGWDARHAYFETTARPVTERMLAMLRPRPGQTILELAAGTGVVGLSTAALVGASGRVIVSDFAERMVQAAQWRAAQLGLENVECRVLDAERLELPDASVDGVVCRWGYMLMADPGAALSETRRVLRPGGRLAAAVFAGPEENPWVAAPTRVRQQHGHMPGAEAGAPGILALADRDRMTRLLAAADFADVVIDDVPFTWVFNGFGEYWDFLNGAVGAIAMVLARLSQDERARVRSELAEHLGTAAGSDTIELAASSRVVSAS